MSQLLLVRLASPGAGRTRRQPLQLLEEARRLGRLDKTRAVCVHRGEKVVVAARPRRLVRRVGLLDQRGHLLARQPAVAILVERAHDCTRLHRASASASAGASARRAAASRRAAAARHHPLKIAAHLAPVDSAVAVRVDGGEEVRRHGLALRLGCRVGLLNEARHLLPRERAVRVAVEGREEHVRHPARLLLRRVQRLPPFQQARLLSEAQQGLLARAGRVGHRELVEHRAKLPAGLEAQPPLRLAARLCGRRCGRRRLGLGSQSIGLEASPRGRRPPAATQGGTVPGEPLDAGRLLALCKLVDRLPQRLEPALALHHTVINADPVCDNLELSLGLAHDRLA
mmetsp:Transcript_42785/g.138780  ORF Transcript_42785/g.138780 Transcript_42785/m.138780 type:complete len:342 (+) Transcript_42785:111-1136(+)